MARTLIKNLLKGQTHSTDRHIYYDLSIQELEKEWAGIAKQNKEAGISIEDTQEQAILRFNEAQLTIDAKFFMPIHKIKTELSEVQDTHTQMRERHEDYVESEKKTIPDKQFERIDMLKTKLKRMQSQSKEQDEISSELKSQYDERQD